MQRLKQQATATEAKSKPNPILKHDLLKSATVPLRSKQLVARRGVPKTLPAYRVVTSRPQSDRYGSPEPLNDNDSSGSEDLDGPSLLDFAPTRKSRKVDAMPGKPIAKRIAITQRQPLEEMAVDADKTLVNPEEDEMEEIDEDQSAGNLTLADLARKPLPPAKAKKAQETTMQLHHITKQIDAPFNTFTETVGLDVSETLAIFAEDLDLLFNRGHLQISEKLGAVFQKAITDREELHELTADMAMFCEAMKEIKRKIAASYIELEAVKQQKKELANAFYNELKTLREKHVAAFEDLQTEYEEGVSGLQAKASKLYGEKAMRSGFSAKLMQHIGGL